MALRRIPEPSFKAKKWPWRWKLMGLGALGVTGMAAAALASLIMAYWSEIWRLLRGG
ncbi:DUF1515 family protein [Mesorhizobium newzealandense]|uniref:DUF1515 family protein n=1 Tax=Mesorhizobium newzealandense TaxID=1300302 RepID=A0ABW4UB97_9HYPH